MSDMLNIINEKDILKRCKLLEDLYIQARNSINEVTLDNNDIILVIQLLNTINNPNLWHPLWRYLLSIEKNELLRDYCQKRLGRTSQIVERVYLRLNYLLHYLYKNYPEGYDKYIKDFIDHIDTSVRMVAAEILAQKNIDMALSVMVEMYLSENRIGYDHDIDDAICIWIQKKGTEKVYVELEKKKIETCDNKTIHKCEYLQQHFRFK